MISLLLVLFLQVLLFFFFFFCPANNIEIKNNNVKNDWNAKTQANNIDCKGCVIERECEDSRY